MLWGLLYGWKFFTFRSLSYSITDVVVDILVIATQKPFWCWLPPRKAVVRLVITTPKPGDNHWKKFQLILYPIIFEKIPCCYPCFACRSALWELKSSLVEFVYNFTYSMRIPHFKLREYQIRVISLLAPQIITRVIKQTRESDSHI